MDVKLPHNSQWCNQCKANRYLHARGDAFVPSNQSFCPKNLDTRTYILKYHKKWPPCENCPKPQTNVIEEQTRCYQNKRPLRIREEMLRGYKNQNGRICLNGRTVEKNNLTIDKHAVIIPTDSLIIPDNDDLDIDSISLRTLELFNTHYSTLGNKGMYSNTQLRKPVLPTTTFEPDLVSLKTTTTTYTPKVNNQSLRHQDLSNPSPIISPEKSKTGIQIPVFLSNDTHAAASIITLDSKELNGQPPYTAQQSRSSFETVEYFSRLLAKHYFSKKKGLEESNIVKSPSLGSKAPAIKNIQFPNINVAGSPGVEQPKTSTATNSPKKTADCLPRIGTTTTWCNVENPMKNIVRKICAKFPGMELDENLRYHGTDETDEYPPTTDNQSPSYEPNTENRAPSIVVPKKYDMALCFDVPQRSVLKVDEQSNSPTKTSNIPTYHQNDVSANKSTYSSLVDSSVIGKRIGIKRRGRSRKRSKKSEGRIAKTSIEKTESTPKGTQEGRNHKEGVCVNSGFRNGKQTTIEPNKNVVTMVSLAKQF